MKLIGYDNIGEFEDKTRRQFRRWSRFYDSKLVRWLYFERVYGKTIALLRDVVGERLGEGIRALDVACGTGEVIYRLGREFPASRFVGMDITPEMLEKATQKIGLLKNVVVKEGNVRKMPFADNSFDVLLSVDAFHHFASGREAAREMSRVVRRGGVLLVVDPAFESVWQKVLVGGFGRIGELHAKYYSRRDMEELFRQAGYSLRSVVSHYLNNFFVFDRR